METPQRKSLPLLSVEASLRRAEKELEALQRVKRGHAEKLAHYTLRVTQQEAVVQQWRDAVQQLD